MKKTYLFVCLILICSLLLSSCSSFFYEYIDPILSPEDQYYKGANWNCELDVFATTYLELYTQKIEELKEKYDLSFTVKYEIEENSEEQRYIICFILYDEDYTFRFYLHNHVWIGYLSTYLYYYGYHANPDSYPEYSSFASLFGFINDFTNYAGYDTNTDKNCFEELYFEVLNSEKSVATYNIHFDNYSGNIGYGLRLKEDGGYFHMALYDNELVKYCLRCDFDGYMKPLI